MKTTITSRFRSCDQADVFAHHKQMPTSCTKPEPADGEVAELVKWLRENAEWERFCYESDNRASLYLDRAADLLAQRHPAPVPVAVSERLPELRPRFEATLNGARCLSNRPVGNVQLADRLLDDVLAWHTTPPEAKL